MKIIRRSEQTNSNVARADLRKELYFFYERNTGVSHFHVEAGADGRFPVDQAAGLLAMHCLVRGQSPRDYVVMVQAAPDALEGLAEKAEQSLRADGKISRVFTACEVPGAGPHGTGPGSGTPYCGADDGGGAGRPARDSSFASCSTQIHPSCEERRSDWADEAANAGLISL